MNKPDVLELLQSQAKELADVNVTYVCTSHGFRVMQALKRKS